MQKKKRKKLVYRLLSLVPQEGANTFVWHLTKTPPQAPVALCFHLVVNAQKFDWRTSFI